MRVSRKGGVVRGVSLPARQAPSCLCPAHPWQHTCPPPHTGGGASPFPLPSPPLPSLRILLGGFLLTFATTEHFETNKLKMKSQQLIAYQ